MVTVALIASIVSIILAGFAIWQANHHRDQSDKLNRDTTEKLARIEAFATSTKEDAFAEIRRWGDFARASGKTSEEAERAKEEEMRKLKEEIQATTAVEINKVLQTVESKLSSSGQASTISEIKNEFEELKRQIGKIQEKGLGDVKKLEIRKNFNPLWLSLSIEQRELLVRTLTDPIISKEKWQRARMSTRLGFTLFIELLRLEDVISSGHWIEPGARYRLKLTPAFREFLETVKEDEME